MIKEVTFITGNPKKVTEFKKYLPVKLAHKKLDLTEIQSLDLDEIVEHKAKEAYRLVKRPVLVEDVSLEFFALGKLPGPFIKWFLNEVGNQGLCKILDNFKSRQAVVKVAYALYDGRKLKIFRGEVKGSVAKTVMKGDWKFGFNQIFIPNYHKKSWSQMDEKEQEKTSFRLIALKKLHNYLEKQK